MVVHDVTDIGGYAEPGFGPVADAFAGNFTRGELGAAFALRVDGEPVVDLWGGVADPRTGRPWEQDTLAVGFSLTKGVSSIVAHMLVERGQLELDAPVTTYWPEFGAAGKQATTVRHVLSHRTGLPAVDGPVTREQFADPDVMAARLAAQTPVFEPGTNHVYQAVTFSWTFGELVRRITGASVGTFVARELAGPLDLDVYVGLPADLESRVAPISPPDIPAELVALVMPEGSMPWRALTINGLFPITLVGDETGLNDPEARRMELPAANGVVDARSLAKLYAATIGTVDGIRLLREDTVAAASVVQSSGVAWGEDGPGATWGTGFMRPFPRQPMLGGASFGHDGAGGSLAFAEPERGVAFAHLVNQMLVVGGPDPRTSALVEAVRACLDR
jgi:CubicO group peptidase (beta-lactamase class C family)